MTTLGRIEVGGSARCGAAGLLVTCSSDAKGGDVAVAVLVESTKCSRETYERIRRRLGSRKPAGGIFHIAGPSPNGGWRVVEVWESEEDADRFFRQQFIPALREAGVRRLPRRELWTVHAAMR
jgi:hypothetical protein